MRDYGIVILAAGLGSRMESSTKKQYMRLGNRRVIDYSIEIFQRFPYDIVIVLDDVANAENLPSHPQITYVQGGATRDKSIQNGFEALAPCRFVLVHDAARPFATQRVIRDVMAALQESDCAYPVAPVVSTVVYDDNGTLAGTPDRAGLRHIQTPQGFSSPWLARILEDAEQTHPHIPERVRALGGSVVHVEGSPWLMKVTYPPSIFAAEAYVADFCESEGLADPK